MFMVIFEQNFIQTFLHVFCVQKLIQELGNCFFSTFVSLIFYSFICLYIYACIFFKKPTLCVNVLTNIPIIILFYFFKFTFRGFFFCCYIIFLSFLLFISLLRDILLFILYPLKTKETEIK